MKTPSKKSRISFNHDRREIFVNGKERHLAPAEYAILHALFLTGKALTRADLSRALGHNEDTVDAYAASRTVDQHICRLKRKIGAGIIQTVTSHGYKLSSAAL